MWDSGIVSQSTGRWRQSQKYPKTPHKCSLHFRDLLNSCKRKAQPLVPLKSCNFHQFPAKNVPHLGFKCSQFSILTRIRKEKLQACNEKLRAFEDEEI